MPYVTDNLGNRVWVNGDDTSLQEERMAGMAGTVPVSTGTAVATPQSNVMTENQLAQQGYAVTPAARNNIFANIRNAVSNAAGQAVVPGGNVGNVGSMGIRGNFAPKTESNPATGVATGGNRTYQPITSMEQLAQAMGYTSPQEEARLKKASLTKQRILAVGDALRHIGNIANTVGYAPSQQFNSPVLEEEQRYEKGKALRDAANARYMSYAQQKERQDALQRRWENELEYKRQKEAAAAKARQEKAKDAHDKWEKTLEYRKENDEKNRQQREKNNEFNREDKTRRTDAYVAKTMGGGGSAGGGRRRVKSGTGRSANGKMNYWIDVPGEGRVYYPNQTMWKQGIDYYDNKGARYTKTPGGKEEKVPYTQRGANLGRQAAARRGQTTTQKKTTTRQGKSKGTNKSGFFN